ncbi:MAG TPA: hypothetical protein VD906_09470 [Caulobacteraceae bacterium]|nr:hypothetical protein [Caulobacteraceae bacterium]
MTFCACVANADEKPSVQPDLSQLAGLCHNIANRESAAAKRKIYLAAGLAPGDSRDIAKAKIQHMWNEGGRQGLLTCDADNFDIPKGHVLKYSLRMREYSLLASAIEDWGIDLNQADGSGEGTLLDYLDKLLVEFRGQEIAEDLRLYRTMVEQAGGVRAADLPPDN